MEVRAEWSEIKTLKRTKWDLRPANSSASQLANIWPSGTTIPSMQAPSTCPGSANQARGPPIPLSCSSQRQLLLTNPLFSCANHTMQPNHTCTHLHKCTGINYHPFFFLPSQWKKTSLLLSQAKISFHLPSITFCLLNYLKESIIAPHSCISRYAFFSSCLLTLAKKRKVLTILQYLNWDRHCCLLSTNISYEPTESPVAGLKALNNPNSESGWCLYCQRYFLGFGFVLRRSI